MSHPCSRCLLLSVSPDRQDSAPSPLCRRRLVISSTFKGPTQQWACSKADSIMTHSGSGTRLRQAGQEQGVNANQVHAQAFASTWDLGGSFRGRSFSLSVDGAPAMDIV